MAITWIDGYDLCSANADASLRYTITNSPTFVTGRLGTGKALSLLNAGILWGGGFPSAQSTLAFGAAIKMIFLPGTTKEVIRFRNGATSVVVVGYTSTGAIRVGSTDFAGGLLGTSAAAVIADSVFAYVEVEITRSATVGIVNVYVNGAQVLNLTGLNLGSLNIDTFFHQNQNDGITTVFDDMYITNTAAKLGESRVDVIRPSADTATAQWTPLAGTHVSNLNSTAYDGDTSYVSDSTVADKDLYDVTDLAFTPTVVRAVQTVLCARKDDVATRAIRTNLKSGGTTANGATISMPSAYAVTCDIFETDPNTAAAWTVANVNAAQLGLETVT